SKNKKYHEKEPKTPFQRLIESPDIDDNAKTRLQSLYQTLNPFQIKKVVNKKLKCIFNIASVSSFMSQN
ncbi:MAG: integrase, partial [Candidatus Margulisiibacteriota bacterium]